MEIEEIFKIIDIQEDNNLNCYSVLTKVEIQELIKLVEKSHENRGNIKDQRGVLQTRSAKIIRNQMVEDLIKGGILPPIVLGMISHQEIDKDNFLKLIENSENKKEIIILDGMQRIQALKEAQNQSKIDHNLHQSEIDHNLLRVEFWFAPDESALLYRMLVLNSGQIPWGLDKQLEVVFKPVLQRMKHKIYNLDSLIYEKKLYTQSEIVELFLAFTSRKVRIDKKQQLAEYHSALDIMSLLREKSGHIIDKFETMFELMVEIDQLFSGIEDRYVFTNQTARVGFMVACAEQTFGLLGNNIDKDPEKVNENFENITLKLNKIRVKIQNQNDQERQDFIDLELLKQQLRSIPKEKHRQAFLDGFKVLFSESEINSFAVCWNKMY